MKDQIPRLLSNTRYALNAREAKACREAITPDPNQVTLQRCKALSSCTRRQLGAYHQGETDSQNLRLNLQMSKCDKQSSVLIRLTNGTNHLTQSTFTRVGFST